MQPGAGKLRGMRRIAEPSGRFKMMAVDQRLRTAMQTKLESDRVSYMPALNDLTDRSATVWHKHACYGPCGALFDAPHAEFRNGYTDI